MKTKRIIMIVLAAMLIVSTAFAAGTPAGTAIRNFATGAYRDANGNQMENVISNTVETIVSQVAGLDISPATQTTNMVLYGTVAFPLVLTNTGNGTDAFDLEDLVLEIPGAVFTSKIYHDVNGNGVVDDGEEEVSVTSDLAADASYDLVVLVENIEGYDGALATVLLTASSQFDEDVIGTAEMSAEINTSVFTYTLTADNNNPQPGDIVTYTFNVANTGSAPAPQVVCLAYAPSNTTYLSGSILVKGVSVTDETDDDMGQVLMTSQTTIGVNFGNVNSGESVSASFRVVVNDNVPVGTIIENEAALVWNNILNEQQEIVEGNAENATLTVAQIYFVAVGADQVAVGDPSDFVYYPVTVTNTGNGPDLINLYYDNTLTSWTYYLDKNQNGAIDENEAQLNDSNGDGMIDLGILTQGEEVFIVMKGQIPVGTPDETTDVLTLTAQSLGNGAENDKGQLTVTVTAPILSLLKSVSPQGNQPPGTTLTYSIIVLNGGTGEATDLQIEDEVPENTSYKLGSMRLEAKEMTDDADKDEAKYEHNKVKFVLPTLEAGASTTIRFQTVIN